MLHNPIKANGKLSMIQKLWVCVCVHVCLHPSVLCEFPSGCKDDSTPNQHEPEICMGSEPHCHWSAFNWVWLWELQSLRGGGGGCQSVKGRMTVWKPFYFEFCTIKMKKIFVHMFQIHLCTEDSVSEVFGGILCDGCLSALFCVYVCVWSFL